MVDQRFHGGSHGGSAVGLCGAGLAALVVVVLVGGGVRMKSGCSVCMGGPWTLVVFWFLSDVDLRTLFSLSVKYL